MPAPFAPFTTIVSGLPRSGTSLMMQMLAAGGMPVLTDLLRACDPDNPRGYFEFEPVKSIQRDASWLAQADGKAVKIVHLLLLHLPAGHAYRVLFMRRHLDEVLASQRKMLDRQGRTGARLSDEQLKALYTQQIEKVLSHLRSVQNVQVMEINYADLIADPPAAAARVQAFLQANLDKQAMASAVDPALYRNRR
jgi:hypothetical protein